MDQVQNDKEHLELQYELKAIRIQMEANTDVISTQLEAILNQTKKTNGRVDKLEDDFGSFKKSVDFVTTIAKNKWLLIVLIAGIYFIFKNFDFISWAKKIF